MYETLEATLGYVRLHTFARWHDLVMDLTPYLSSFPWLGGLPELSSGSFTWELNEADNSWLFGVYDSDQVSRYLLPDGWVPLGWCDAGIIQIRPRPGQIVVMFGLDGRDFWHHLMPM